MFTQLLTALQWGHITIALSVITLPMNQVWHPPQLIFILKPWGAGSGSVTVDIMDVDVDVDVDGDIWVGAGNCCNC